MAEFENDVKPIGIPNIRPMRLRYGIGGQLPLQPGLNDTPELVQQKEILDLLAFKAAVPDSNVFIYPDANGSGILTRGEIEGLLSSQKLSNPKGKDFWPQGKKLEFEAMIAQDNPSVLIREYETAPEKNVNMTNHAPRVPFIPFENQLQYHARWFFVSANWCKVKTDSSIGNRYATPDMDNDGKITLGEAKEFYQHPEMEGKLPLRFKSYLELKITSEAGTVSRETNRKTKPYFISDVYRNEQERGKYFQEHGKYPDELQSEIDKGLVEAFNSTSKDDSNVSSMQGMLTSLKGWRPNPRYPFLPTPFPTNIESFEEFDSLKEDETFSERLNASGKKEPAPLTPAKLTVMDKAPEIAKKNNETVEEFMARKEWLQRALIPASISDSSLGKKTVYVCLDANMDGVVKHQEIITVLNSKMPATMGGKRISEILTEGTNYNLLSAANNSQVVPASLEKLKETMKEKVFDVKEGASNEAFLKVLDVDANKVVTIGELKYKQNQAETMTQTAQSK